MKTPANEQKPISEAIKMKLTNKLIGEIFYAEDLVIRAAKIIEEARKKLAEINESPLLKIQSTQELEKAP